MARFKPTKPGDPPTEKQAAIFRYLYEATRDTGIQPSMRDLMARFGWGSPHAATGHLEALARKGWIGAPARGASGHRARKRAMKFLRRPDGTAFSGFSDKPPEDEP